MPKSLRLLLQTLALALLLSPLCLAGEPADVAPPGDTTVILVRHAEKDRSNPQDNDPRLTEDGKARAQELVHVLGEVGVEVVYATPFRRTRDTAKPLAEHLGLEVKKAATGNHEEVMAMRIRERHAGQTVVVVGHSNTTPGLARELGVEDPPIIEDHVYDELWLLTVPGGAGRPTRMLRLRFGTPSPEEPDSGP